MDFMYGLAMYTAYYIQVMATTGRFMINGLFKKKSKEEGCGGRGVENMEFPGVLKEKHVEIPGESIKKKWKF